MTGIYTRTLPELDRTVQIGVAGEKLISVSFLDTTDTTREESHPLLEQFSAYAAGEEVDFSDVDVGLTVSQTQRAVLETLQSVPYGQTVAFDQLLAMAPGVDPDEESTVDATRAALRENPVPVVIPTHRVINGPTVLPDTLVTQLRELEGISGL